MKSGMGRGVRVTTMAAALWAVVACADDGADEVAGDAATPPAAPAAEGAAAVALGPVDGRDLPRADLDRVTVGDPAPDFSLTSYRGDVLTLSENRGVREIVLVFYRGHW